MSEVTCPSCGGKVEIEEPSRPGVILGTDGAPTLIARRTRLVQCSECGCGAWLSLVESAAPATVRGAEPMWRVTAMAPDVYPSEADAVDALNNGDPRWEVVG